MQGLAGHEEDSGPTVTEGKGKVKITVAPNLPDLEPPHRDTALDPGGPYLEICTLPPDRLECSGLRTPVVVLRSWEGVALQGRNGVLFDLTLPLGPETLVYPGDSPPVIARVSDLRVGDPLTTSYMALGCHVGTHVDAPAHFLTGGATIGELPLEAFYGPARVCSLLGRKEIGAPDVNALDLPEGRHILLRTDNAALLHQPSWNGEYTTLSREAALYLASRNPRSVGFDYYSLDPDGSGDFPAHRILARWNIPVYVCLDLWRVPPGDYLFHGFPLRFEGVEASPVRALLFADPASPKCA